MKEACWKCKQVKDDVELRACDDRLCESCFQLNEAALLLVKRGQMDTRTSATGLTPSQSAEKTNDRKCDMNEKGAAKSVSGNDRIFVNELLSYASFYRDRANLSAAQRVVLSFYSPTEISAAKKLLSSLFSTKLVNCPHLVERRKSSSRSAHDAEVEDIFGILEFLDRADALSSTIFAAVDFDRVPHYGPEEINICTVVDRQVRADASIEQLAQAVESLLGRDASEATSDTSIMGKVETVVDTVNVRVTAAIDHQLKRLDSICEKFQQASIYAARPSQQPGTSAYSNNDIPDRTMNIVVFGVTEDKNRSVWHSKLSAALQHVTGRPVDISDAFRIGKFNANQSRPRPIIVKLRCVWDKRLILSNARKLAEASEYQRIGVVPDEPLEVRRKHTLKRLHDKSMREGKNVTLSTDSSALFIDSNLVFSLKDGFVRNNGDVNNTTNG